MLLRFYHRRELRTVGEARGISEEAARKRVERTLEKQRLILVGRGVSASATALAAALAGQAATAAPVGLAATVTGAAIVGASVSSSTTITVLNLMASTKLKLTAIGALLTASVTTPLLVQHHQLASSFNLSFLPPLPAKLRNEAS